MHSAVVPNAAPTRNQQLIARIAQSDEAALAELYDRFSRPAYGLALRIVRDPELAEDVVIRGEYCK